MKPIQTEKEFKWQRLQTIMEAIQSYREQCKTVRFDWVSEKIKLEKELGLREERDVPVKVEKFVWTDELVKEFVKLQFPPKFFIVNPDKMISGFKKLKYQAPIKVDAGKEWEILEINYQEMGYDKGHIKSIRRLSDSGIFTIGDFISWSNAGNVGKISKFEISQRNGQMLAICSDCGVSINRITHQLPKNEIIEQKPVLFVTEDGVEIRQGYSGDLWRVFIVNHSYEMWKPYNLGMPQYINSKEEKYFITEQAAKDYCLYNCPCLSVNDVKGLDLDISITTRTEKLPYGNEIDLILFTPEQLEQCAKSKQSLPVEDKNPDYAERPPLGIIPEWRWKELRLQDVQEAIDRCVEDDKPVPTDFIEEKYQLQTWLNKRKQLNALMNGNNSEKQSLPETKPMSESKTERIVVDVDGSFDFRTWYKSAYHFIVDNGYRIPKEKFSEIKSAIERVLNNEPELKLTRGLDDTLRPFETTYTQQQMDKAITDAFNAARERNGQNEVALQIKPFMKYEDAADYLKSIYNQK